MSLTEGIARQFRLEDEGSIAQFGEKARNPERKLKVVATAFELTREEVDILHPARFIAIQSNGDDAEETLIEAGATVFISDRVPDARILQRWRDMVPGLKILLIFQPYLSAKILNSTNITQPDLVCSFFDRRARSLGHALLQAEIMFLTEQTSVASADLIRSTHNQKGRRVAVVGAGAVGLVSALEFAEAEYQVDVFERSPDPRRRAHWTAFGCTHGGENARMFSLTECDNYHDRAVSDPAGLHSHIDKPLEALGWSLGYDDRYSAKDRAWRSEFREVPIFLADHYNEDIFELNHQSYALWQQLIQSRPHLFESVVMTDGLLRICRTAAYHEKQLLRQKHVRALIRELDRDQLIDTYPALEIGCANSEIHGGIEVEGFTLNIHSFVRNLINYLESIGVTFHWNTPVDGINRRDSEVWGLEVGGEVRQWDHYFISPGAYPGSLLDATLSHNAVQGVLGAWITIPNAAPKLQRSMKVSREGHIAGSGNIILAQDEQGADRLIFGSGFGYVGHDVENISEDRLERLFSSMQDYISRLFPDALHTALEDGSLVASKKYCIRPWTPTSLGVFEVQQARSGCLIVASGHNTGGFAQSPSVAKAAIAAVRGEDHTMHRLYHPDRFKAFWGSPA